MTTDPGNVTVEEMPQPTPVTDEEKPDYLRGGAENEWFKPGANVKTDDTEKQRPKLGENRVRRGGPPQLTNKDIEQLRGLYAGMGMAVMPFHQRGAKAIVEQSDACVDAWVDLSKQNDSVRRALLAVLEGGAWGIVLTAHVPIAMAFVPEHVMERMPLLFGQQDNEEGEE